MAKRRFRRARRVYSYVRRRAKGGKIPLAVVAGVVATPSIQNFVNNMLNKRYDQAMKSFGGFAGLGDDGQFYLNVLTQNWIPVLAGVAGHKIASKLGVNRAIAKIPYVNL